MKDVTSCDKPRGGAYGPGSADVRMGEPACGHAHAPAPERIRCEEATRGTETSKYPEEEKSTEIARVAASESAPAQTHARVSRQALLRVVLRGRPPRVSGPGPPPPATPARQRPEAVTAVPVWSWPAFARRY